VGIWSQPCCVKLFVSGEPGGTRTRDPLLKRQMLYRLSYRPCGGTIFSLA
jgi:hypothetical protein